VHDRGTAASLDAARRVAADPGSFQRCFGRPP
jgi:hypothetical protein